MMNNKELGLKVAEFIKQSKSAGPVHKINTDSKVNKIPSNSDLNPREFFASYNIHNDSQLNNVLEELKKKQEESGESEFSDSFIEMIRDQKREGYMYVMSILSHAISTIKEFLGKDARYDIANWHASGKDLNIIEGVLKEGKPIIILIRPTDGNQIIFHTGEEKNVLTRDDSELWGCKKSSDTPQLITFGMVLKWNNIN